MKASSSVSRDDGLNLADILEACDLLRTFVAGVSFEQFEASSEKRSAVERPLFIIGDAAARLPDVRRASYPDVPWRRIIGLRNLLAHGYWTIEPAELWDIVQSKVPDLQVRVEAMRDDG